jgi:hypothetical protein
VLSHGTPRRIGVLIEHEGFFVSDDLGQNWSAEASNTLGRLINLIVTSRHDNRRLFALTLDRVFSFRATVVQPGQNAAGFLRTRYLPQLLSRTMMPRSFSLLRSLVTSTGVLTAARRSAG